MKRVHIYVAGRVQGVCFRMYACEQARRLGLTGWIRNLSDGRVEAVAEGQDGAVDEFLEWCGRGPPHAVVTKLTATEEPAAGEFSDFSICY